MDWTGEYYVEQEAKITQIYLPTVFVGLILHMVFGFSTLGFKGASWANYLSGVSREEYKFQLI
jgi:hypothetical protein